MKYVLAPIEIARYLKTKASGKYFWALAFIWRLWLSLDAGKREREQNIFTQLSLIFKFYSSSLL